MTQKTHANAVMCNFPAVIIHARLSSSRLPEKVLRPINGREMLLRQIDRMRLCQNSGPLVIATSDQPKDDAIAALCERESVHCFRGSLNDVTERILGAATSVNASALVRLSGDSPFLDPHLVDTLIAIYQACRCDLATNVQKRTFPKGQSVEVVSVATLRTAHSEMTHADREHVTVHFYRNEQRYKISNLTSGENWGDVQLSVDTPEDFAMAERLFATLNDRHKTTNWKDITNLSLELARHV